MFENMVVALHLFVLRLIYGINYLKIILNESI